jgi:DNA-binding phage protein
MAQGKKSGASRLGKSAPKHDETPCTYTEEVKYPGVKRSLDELIGNRAETFSQMLLRLIDTKGMTDVEVYKRANISRQHFSKMRNPSYRPTKRTVVALAVALELSLDDTRELLARAGFALTHSSKFDIIVEYFIRQGNYDTFAINETLFAYDQPILG